MLFDIPVDLKNKINSSKEKKSQMRSNYNNNDNSSFDEITVQRVDESIVDVVIVRELIARRK